MSAEKFVCISLEELFFFFSSFSSTLSLNQGDSSSSVAPMPAGTPVSNDLFSQALQQALQASNMSALQVRLQITSCVVNSQGHLKLPVFLYLSFFEVRDVTAVRLFTYRSSGSSDCARPAVV